MSILVYWEQLYNQRMYNERKYRSLVLQRSPSDRWFEKEQWVITVYPGGWRSLVNEVF